MSFSEAQANVLYLPQRKLPFPGMVWIAGWLCRKCGYSWVPKAYEAPPIRCSGCNQENWLEPKQGEEAAEPMKVPRPRRRQ